jgi:cellulose biosynthesis protein BcsQ
VVPGTVALVNQKGGVGKTTVTLGLASAAAAAGRRVLVVDVDPQGSSTWVLGYDPYEVECSIADVLDRADAEGAVLPSAWGDGVDLIPASPTAARHDDRDAIRLADALADLVDDYDAVLLDCPPSLGGLTTNALAAADQALIVVEPSALSLRGIAPVADLVDQVWDEHNPTLELAGVVVNRVPAISGEAERRLEELDRIVGREAVWHPFVPLRVVLTQAVGERRPIHDFRSRAGDVPAVFDALWARVLGLVSWADR